jgi:hypothetical protein
MRKSALIALCLVAFVVGVVKLSRWRPTHTGAIDINGRTIAFAYRGSGSPAVICMEGGFGHDDGKWEPWLPQVDTTTFSYDRWHTRNAGQVEGERTPTRIVEELHALLTQVGIQPPFILAGRSVGGLYSRAFAMRYPHEVAGLVLIDGSHERQWIEFNRIDPTNWPMPGPSDPNAKKPEFIGLAETMKSGQLEIDGKLPDVPMVVVTSLHHTISGKPVRPDEEVLWRNLQSEIFQSTSYGMHIVTAKSGHNIALTEPDLELNAIRWVLDAARAKKTEESPPATGAAPLPEPAKPLTNSHE